MKRTCEICEKIIKTDNEEKPEYLTITGWVDDNGQANLDVCKECFVNRPQEIIDKLKEMEYE